MSASNINTNYGTKVKYESRYFTFGSKSKITPSLSVIVQFLIGQLEAVDCKLATIEKGGNDDRQG